MNITSEDATFFLDMIGSWKSPNYQPNFGRRKPYYALLKDPESNELKRFIQTYEAIKYILTEKEQLVLNQCYGVAKKSAPMHIVGSELNIGPERVRQIKAPAEYRLAMEITKTVQLEKI
jgi:DNA-directed RNA polymerase sigma subunit (sigma70/sigma32)